MKQASSGVFVFVLLGFATDVESAPRREICETWRDYYYNIETGEFIEWVGEPYQICYPADEPYSRPDTSPDDYGGGWGIPRDPKKPTCHQCTREGDACTEKAEDGTDICLEHYRAWARSWCERHHTDIDNRLIDDFTCTMLDDPSGKPVRHCYGNGIDKCVDSYERGSPTSTSQSTIKVNIGSDWFGVGVDTSSVTWGGEKGFKEGCREAEVEAVATCAAQQSSCEADAGGCR
jgi:hypothetical protein